MNPFVLALVAKAIHDQNRGYYRRNSRKRKKSPEKKSSYYDKKYTEEEYLYGLIVDDTVLTAFFQAIEKKGDEIDRKDAEIVRQEVEDGLKEQAERADKIHKKQEELVALGVNLEKRERSYYYDGVIVGKKVTDTYKRAFGDKGEYSLEREEFPVVFDGLYLDRKWFTKENINTNPFEAEYIKWKEGYPDIDKRLEEEEAKLKKAERRLNHAIFGRDKRETEVYIAERCVEEFKGAKERGKKIKLQYDTFAKLTPEQRIKIGEYFELIEEAEKAGKAIGEKANEYDAIMGKGYSNKAKSVEERRKWPRAIEALIEEGELSEELLDAVDSIIAQEEIGYEKYSEGVSSYDMSHKGFSGKFCEVVRWYYDTRKEKIALKALQRKEAAYKALEEEHKRLCEAAGLVDKAEALENQDPKKVKEGDEKNGE